MIRAVAISLILATSLVAGCQFGEFAAHLGATPPTVSTQVQQ